MARKEDKRTLVFGASLKPERYSNIAIHRLIGKGYDVVGIGGRLGTVEEASILTGHPKLKEIHTITMYMGKQRQEEHIPYLLSLKPKRIIFNPGAENIDLFLKAKKEGIEVLNACTLVLLSTGQY